MGFGMRTFRMWSVVVAMCSLVLPATTIAASPCWSAPVTASITDPFRPPRCRWCPGNRGLEYATAIGDVVHAVATGTVTFSGTIAGTSYVVIQLSDGLRVTYGGLANVTLVAGNIVVRSSVVGRAAGHVHFGVRDGDEYLDPTGFIGTWHSRPRLVPANGDAPAAAPPPQLRCPVQQ